MTPTPGRGAGVGVNPAIAGRLRDRGRCLMGLWAAGPRRRTDKPDLGASCAKTTPCWACPGSWGVHGATRSGGSRRRVAELGGGEGGPEPQTPARPTLGRVTSDHSLGRELVESFELWSRLSFPFVARS